MAEQTIDLDVDPRNIGRWVECDAFQILPMPDGGHRIVIFGEAISPVEQVTKLHLHLDGRQIAEAVAKRRAEGGSDDYAGSP